jgi:hypothetical protein
MRSTRSYLMPLDLITHVISVKSIHYEAFRDSVFSYTRASSTLLGPNILPFSVIFFCGLPLARDANLYAHTKLPTSINAEEHVETLLRFPRRGNVRL